MKIYAVLKNYQYEGFSIMSVHKSLETAITVAEKLAEEKFAPPYFNGSVKHNEDGIYVEILEVLE